MIPAPPDDFKLLADNAPVMFWRAAPDLSYDWFNRPWLAFTGLTEEQAREGSGWADLIHQSDLARRRDVVAQALSARQPFSLEYRLRRSDGQFRWILESGNPYYREGQFAGYLGSCVDISDHRSTEKSLRTALDERDFLLREIHHRVKNNLQTLMALVRFMRRSADPSGRALLDLVNARLISMSLVQRYLHAADNLTEVSVRTLLRDIVPQLAETEFVASLNLVDSQSDLVLPAQQAAYTGLAVAEAVVLLQQNGASAIEIRLHEGPSAAVEVAGAANQSDLMRSQLGMRLMRQYARAAGAEPEFRAADERTFLVFVFPKLSKQQAP